MAVSLKKGQKVDLRKSSGETLRNVLIGLGWDPVEPPKKGGLLGLFAAKPPEIDCDASVLLCKNGKLENTADVVYYNNLQHSSGAVRHMGDNLTGGGDGDDEQVMVDLARVPADYDRIVFVVSIYQALQRNQHFGMIRNAFIRIVDNDNNSEMCRFDLTENYDNMTAMVFGELYRKDGGWKFNAIGQGTTDASLAQIVKRYQQ